MSFLTMSATLAAVTLPLVSIGCVTPAAAQAQPTTQATRIVVAMAAADAPARPQAVVAPRVRHATRASAASPGNSDCFWCVRTVYVSGLIY